MKAIIGTSFIRESNQVLLKAGDIVEDFTDDELKKYEGLYADLGKVEDKTKELINKKQKKK